MTRFRSRICHLAAALPFLAACANSSGRPVAQIPEVAIAAAYIPLHRAAAFGLVRDNGAATLFAPGVAVTNAHNLNLIDPAALIGEARDYDLLFFHAGKTGAVPATAPPHSGEAVIAYGQGRDAELRVAHGVVREIAPCNGCTAPAWFTFEGDAGPGFSGGPVVDGEGRLIGIVFGYKDAEKGHQRLIYAYDMARVRSEFSALPQAPAQAAR